MLDAGQKLKEFLEIVLDNVIEVLRSILTSLTYLFPSNSQFRYICVVLAQLRDDISCLLNHTSQLAEQGENSLTARLFFILLLSQRERRAEGGAQQYHSYHCQL